MGPVKREIQLRQIAHFMKADAAHGEGVARGLGLSTSDVAAAAQ